MVTSINSVLEEAVSKQRNTLKSDRLDMTFGEIMHLYEDDMVIIDPEFQRAFRWTIDQCTKFIESILIGIPIPPIFVAEDTEGRWELVDGLQRISTILSFFGELKNDPKNSNNYTLTKGNLIPELEGWKAEGLPIRLSNTIKRAVCRVEILRWDSSIDMRYELFARLNKSGSSLTAQEVRNAVFRGGNEDIYRLLDEFSKNELFIKLMKPTSKNIDEKFDQEMVLRYLYFQYAPNIEDNEKTFQDQLDEFMLMVTKRQIVIDLNECKINFEADFRLLNDSFGEQIFRNKNGKFYPALFDGMSYLLARYRDTIRTQPDTCLQMLETLKSGEEFTKISTSEYAARRNKKRIEHINKLFTQAYGITAI